MKQLVTIAIISLFATGCASGTSGSAPTHRWASNHAANEIQYRNDHARCQAQADLDDSAVALDPASAAFTAYKQCMNSHGYELTAYNN